MYTYFPMGGKIEKLRVDLGCSSSEVAQLLGVDEAEVAGLESQEDHMHANTRLKLREIIRLKNRPEGSIGKDDLGPWLRESVSPYFDGLTPLQAIARGEIAKVWRAVFDYVPTIEWPGKETKEQDKEYSHFLSNG